MFINNCEIEIYEPQYDLEEYEELTGKPKTSYELTHTVPASFQNNSNDDKQEDYGEEYTVIQRIYIQLDLNISKDAIIRKKGHDEEYVLIGQPVNYDILIPHTRLDVQLNRVPKLT